MKYAEVMRAQRALMSLLSQAFVADPTLNELRTEFEEAQKKAMVALDPETTRRLDRMAGLQKQYDQIVATEKAPDMGALLEEGRTIQRALQTTAVKARTRPEVAAKAEAFADAIEARFRQVDPEAFQVLAQHEGWIEAVWAALLVSP